MVPAQLHYAGYDQTSALTPRKAGVRPIGLFGQVCLLNLMVSMPSHLIQIAIIAVVLCQLNGMLVCDISTKYSVTRCNACSKAP